MAATSRASLVTHVSSKNKLETLSSEILPRVLHYISPNDQSCLALTSHFLYNFVVGANKKDALGGNTALLGTAGMGSKSY